ncbi:hypothetical protein K431DRAFT_226148 [Polychaeton citri CBS 116435]|uniref:HPP transmembrane region domain-containing protein n=1 Tax=Polychaeton citri CBS 116435 TaxID=1314669 RepID=A0A9P4Q9K9_9PEZI|nr:hypothetical protein K431DRAFT_226148 [Polychaeton citri CBS 116435]
MAITKDKLLNPDIDAYLNPWLPRNRIDRLPAPVRRFLGYRTAPYVEPPLAIQWCLAFLASVAGICFVGGVFRNAPGISRYHPPALIASLGASAVLDYNAIRSPLAQPRNAVIGNTLSSVCGVAISKAFQSCSTFQEITWVSGAFGCAIASVAMGITGTVHPPGGATAVIASVEPAVVAMGWIYVPLVLLASVMMQFVALLFNNTLRQYPLWWWTAGEVGACLTKSSSRHDEKARGNIEDLEAATRIPSCKTDRLVESCFIYYLHVAC